MKIALIQVPYHMGQYAAGMGAGPLRYIEAGADHHLRAAGFDVAVETVTRTSEGDEMEAVVDLDTQLARRVKVALDQGALPIVLSGNCNSCLGTLTGLQGREPGMIWLDAHGDYNTPETSPSGFFDGMALAIATGQCHAEFAARIGTRLPVTASNTIHIGGRDLDPGEGERMAEAGVRIVAARAIKAAGVAPSLVPALDDLRSRAEAVYLHIDVDVLDPSEAPANEYNNLPGGLTIEEVAEVVTLVAQRFKIAAAAFTAFNPDVDAEGKTVQAGLRLVQVVAERAQGAS